jgi:hypothetical protein
MCMYRPGPGPRAPGALRRRGRRRRRPVQAGRALGGSGCAATDGAAKMKAGPGQPGPGREGGREARFAQGLCMVCAGLRRFAQGLCKVCGELCARFAQVCAWFAQGLRKVYARFAPAFAPGSRMVCAWFAKVLRMVAHGLHRVCAICARFTQGLRIVYAKFTQRELCLSVVYARFTQRKLFLRQVYARFTPDLRGRGFEYPCA